jgi:cold-inducible RNA-binding protein
MFSKHTRIKAKGGRLPLIGKLSSSQTSPGAVDRTTIESQDKKKRVPTIMADTQNLFIGSLAYSTTDDTLKAHFEQIGPVESARVITDRDSGRSKGFGFVQFVNADDNQKAVDQLDGKELDGRAISVGLARPKEDRPRRDFNGGGSNGGGDRGGNGGSFRQRSW